ncbi:MAG TPA: hypothetical protein PLF18_15475 [Anaerolineales bacterium]|nr:hypothetical protein [Anaerolineales bacterium]
MNNSNYSLYFKNILYGIGALATSIALCYFVLLFVLLWVGPKVLSPPAPEMCAQNIENQNTFESMLSSSQRLELIGHFGGTINSIFATDSYLYAGSGPEFAILDVKDPAKPKIIGYTLLPEKVADIYIDGKYAYVATGVSGLRIIDISNPLAPIETGSYTTSVPISEVIVSKGYAYLPLSMCNSGSFGSRTCADAIQIIDVSNSSNPVQISCDKTIDSLASIAIFENYAYISSSSAKGDKIVVMDISQPTQAKQINAYDTSYAGNIAVTGDYIYTSTGYAWFQVLDISDRNNPIETELSYTLNSTNNRNDIRKVVTVEKYAYIVVEDVGIQILDISDPVHPLITGTYSLDEPINDISLIANLMYITTDFHSVQAIDITDPYNPVLIGEYQNAKSVTNVEVIGNLLYAASGDNDFQIIDMLDPKFPSVAGSLNLPEEIKSTTTGGFEKTFVSGLAIDGDRAYLVVKDLGIQTVDISNPNDPVEAGFHPIANGINDIAMDGNNIYITTKDTDFEVLNFQSGTFNKTGSFNMPFNFDDVAIGSRFIYILGEDSGLWIVDASTPEAFTIVGFYQMGAHVYEMKTDSNYLYFATNKGIQIIKLNDEGFPTQEPHVILEDKSFESIMLETSIIYAAENNVLWAINISNPLQPEIAGSYTTENKIREFVKEGDYIYLAIEKNEVSIINAELPSNLVEAGSYIAERIYGEIEVVDHCLYLPSGQDGLKIIDTTNPISPIETNFSIENIWSTNDITTIGNYTYISNHDVFYVLDITNPCQPFVIKQYEIPETSYQNPENSWGNIIAVSSNYAFMGDYADDDRLWILDISTPDTPQKTNYYQTMHGASGVDTQDDYAYILQGDGLRVIDITNPMLPTEIGSYFEKFTAMSDVMLSDNLAYIANQEDILVFDISKTNNPVKIDSYVLPKNLIASGIAIDDEYLYVATGTNGIFIFKLKG